MSQTTAEAGVFDRAPMFLPSEHFTPGLKVLSNDPSPQKQYQPVTRDDASDSSDYAGTSQSDHSREVFADKWNSAYEARFAPAPTKKASSLPHEATRSQDSAEPLFMSWWPEPEKVMMLEESLSNDANHEESLSVGQKPINKRPSIFKVLENRLDGFLFGAHGHAAAKASPGGHVDTETRNTMSKAPAPVMQSSVESDSLFHVLLTTSHFKKDINATVQGVRVCGTYDTLPAAKAFAHRCLFDAGYEVEWFTTFKTQHGLHLVDHREDKIVEATGPEGEVFTVDISTIPNVFGLKSNNEAKRVQTPLYHVVQTIVHYRDDESGQTRDTTIQGSFPTYDRACGVAHSLLLWSEDGIAKNTYAQYEEAGPGELDCGYGENVVVHAVGQNGENYLVSVLKSQEMEAERVMEAASEIC